MYSFTDNTVAAWLLCFNTPSLELYHPTPRPDLTKCSFLETQITYFPLSSFSVSLSPDVLSLSQWPQPTPFSVWGSNQPAGVTFRLSDNFLKFSSRFCLEPLDSFLRPPRPIIIWLGLSGDHCLLSLGSSWTPPPPPRPSEMQQPTSVLYCEILMVWAKGDTSLRPLCNLSFVYGTTEITWIDLNVHMLIFRIWWIAVAVHVKCLVWLPSHFPS